MTQPLALLLYERLMPGSKLLNMLEDRQYRVRAINTAAQLVETACAEKPMLVVADMVAQKNDVSSAITQLRNTPDTRHIPVVAIVPAGDDTLEKEARVAGATLVATDNAIIMHLSQLLEQALQVD